MKTIFAATLSRLGLSQTGAAALLEVSIDSVKSWCAGRHAIPPGIWDVLRAAEDEIADAGAELMDRWLAAGSPAIEINAKSAGRAPLMAAADFLLGVDAPVRIGRTAATDAARQTRRFTGGA